MYFHPGWKFKLLVIKKADAVTKIPKQQLVIKLMSCCEQNGELEYICASKNHMENTKKYTGLYWILFILSVIAFIGLYQVIGGVSILVLPFNCTFFAKALDIM
jgi:hypothetical protein